MAKVNRQVEDALVVERDGEYEQAFFVAVHSAAAWDTDETRGIKRGVPVATIGHRAGDKMTCQRSTLRAMTADELRSFASLLVSVADRMEDGHAD